MTKLERLRDHMKIACGDLILAREMVHPMMSMTERSLLAEAEFTAQAWTMLYVTEAWRIEQEKKG